MRVRLVDSNGKTVEKSFRELTIAGHTVDKSLIDLYSIANGIFQIEDSIHNGFDISGITFQCYSSYPSELSQQIASLVEFMFGRTLEVAFEKNPQSLVIDWSPEEFVEGYTCLFSAGLDSYVGLLEARKNLGGVEGAFTRHSDQGALSKLATSLERGMQPTNFATVKAPRHQSYTRLSRGILYILNAFLLLNRNVIISEVGPTMYQPRFTLLDHISMTTHPAILKFSKRIAEEVVGTKLAILRPNENLTKAELASIGSGNSSLGKTCSCSYTAFAASARPNCGTCYACVVRRLALLVAGVEENGYRANWLRDSKIDNILHLIRFSLDYLTDVKSVHWYSLDSVRRNHKEDLFRRFSQDNLAGLFLMKKQGLKIAPALERLLTLALESVSGESLEERISIVRERTAAPDYRNII